MKSKTSPRTRISSSSARSALSVGGTSSILERDVAQDGGHPFGLVGRVLEELVQVVPAHRFDQLRHLDDAVVQRGDRLRQQIVGLVLESMDFLGGTLECFGLAAFFEQWYRPRNLLGLFEDDFGELA